MKRTYTIKFFYHNDLRLIVTEETTSELNALKKALKHCPKKEWCITSEFKITIETN